MEQKMEAIKRLNWSVAFEHPISHEDYMIIFNALTRPADIKEAVRVIDEWVKNKAAGTKPLDLGLIDGWGMVKARITESE